MSPVSDPNSHSTPRCEVKSNKLIAGIAWQPKTNRNNKSRKLCSLIWKVSSCTGCTSLSSFFSFFLGPENLVKFVVELQEQLWNCKESRAYNFQFVQVKQTHCQGCQGWAKLRKYDYHLPFYLYSKFHFYFPFPTLHFSHRNLPFIWVPITSVWIYIPCKGATLKGIVRQQV